VSGIEGLFNFTCQIKGRDTDVDSIVTNDEWNQPIETGHTVLATVPCAVQERSQREEASLVGIGEVASTHRVYLNGAVVDESRIIHVVELDVDLEVVGVRDGGGRGHHLEIDALERTNVGVVQAGS
jgi:hypothetical protein